MKKLFCALLCAFVIASAFAGCNNNDGKDNNNSSSSATADSADSKKGGYIEIAAKNCTLKYPDKWKDKIKTSTEDKDVYSVRFSSGDIKLFDIMFGGNSGTVLGTLKQKDGNTVLYIKDYALDKKHKNDSELLEMKEDINFIINNLSKDYDFAKGQKIEDSSNELYEIKTDVVNLYYPKRWKDSVTTNVSKNGVKFSYNKTPLFDVLFGGQKGVLLGTYKDTEIFIKTCEIKKDKLKDSDYSKALLMQEDMDYLLKKLTGLKDFKQN